MSKWLAASKLVLNLDETNTIQFVTNKVFAFLGCDALLIGSQLLTFWDSLLTPYARSAINIYKCKYVYTYIHGASQKFGEFDRKSFLL